MKETAQSSWGAGGRDACGSARVLVPFLPLKPRVSEPETEGIELCNEHPLPVLLLPHTRHLAGGALSPHQTAVSPGCCRGQPLKRGSPGQPRCLWLSQLVPFPPERALCSPQTRNGPQGLCTPHPCSLRSPSSENPHSCHNTGLPFTPVTLQPHGPANAYACPAPPPPAAPRAPLRSQVLNTLATATTELPLPGNSSTPAGPTWIT